MKAVGTHMGLGIVQDGFRGSGLNEFLQYEAAADGFVFYQGVQLAIGKGTGTAFAELYVGFGIQLSMLEKAQGI